MVTVRDPETQVETWRKVRREGFAPQLSRAGLQALRRALTEDSPKIIQGATVQPPPLSHYQAWPVDCACPVAFALCDHYGLDIATPSMLDQRFTEACLRCEQLVGWPAAARYFLNQVDEWDRDTMRRELLAEVDWALSQRAARKGGAA